jgi:hypothetical protein
MDETAQLGPSYDGTVLLDIGGDIGALIINTTADLHLAEIEVSRVDDDDVHAHGGHRHAHPHRTHVAVRERRGPSGVRYAAIYPGLRAGEYTVWGSDGRPADTVRIVGGEVAQLDWRVSRRVVRK